MAFVFSAGHLPDTGITLARTASGFYFIILILDSFSDLQRGLMRFLTIVGKKILRSH